MKSFYLKLKQPFCSVQLNHLCNFGRAQIQVSELALFSLKQAMPGLCLALNHCPHLQGTIYHVGFIQASLRKFKNFSRTSKSLSYSFQRQKVKERC